MEVTNGHPRCMERLWIARHRGGAMKFAKRSHIGLCCVLAVMLASSMPAQETRDLTDNSDGIGSSTLLATGTFVSPDCNGTRFNLEPRTNAQPQNTESVDFLPNRVSPGVDLVVGAANDHRPSPGGFDAYYVHRQGSNCGVDFEGALSTSAINPTVVADPARD